MHTVDSDVCHVPVYADLVDCPALAGRTHVASEWFSQIWVTTSECIHRSPGHVHILTACLLHHCALLARGLFAVRLFMGEST